MVRAKLLQMLMRIGGKVASGCAASHYGLYLIIPEGVVGRIRFQQYSQLADHVPDQAVFCVLIRLVVVKDLGPALLGGQGVGQGQFMIPLGVKGVEGFNGPGTNRQSDPHIAAAEKVGGAVYPTGYGAVIVVGPVEKFHKNVAAEGGRVFWLPDQKAAAVGCVGRLNVRVRIPQGPGVDVGPSADLVLFFQIPIFLQVERNRLSFAQAKGIALCGNFEFFYIRQKNRHIFCGFAHNLPPFQIINIGYAQIISHISTF